VPQFAFWRPGRALPDRPLDGRRPAALTAGPAPLTASWLAWPARGVAVWLTAAWLTPGVAAALAWLTPLVSPRLVRLASSRLACAWLCPLGCARLVGLPFWRAIGSLAGLIAEE
jgi:hypothetical protein